jgi:hypothetical protein
MKTPVFLQISSWSVLAVVLVLFTGCSDNSGGNVEHSVARQWNEALLAAIRVDLARPTVHARNLFHTSVAMYDAWAVFDETASTYLLGKSLNDYNCPFDGTTFSSGADQENARKEAVSFAAYRLLSHRFQNSPGVSESQSRFDKLLSDLGYDSSVTSTDYSSGRIGQLYCPMYHCLWNAGWVERTKFLRQQFLSASE